MAKLFFPLGTKVPVRNMSSSLFLDSISFYKCGPSHAEVCRLPALGVNA